MGSTDHFGGQIWRRKFVFSIPARELSKKNQPEAIRFTMFRFSMSLVRRIVRGISSHMVNKFLFFSGSAAVGAALSNPPTPGSGVRGDGRNREEGSLGSSRGGAMAWGSHAGAGLSPAPIKCRESCMWPMFPARGAGRGIRDHFEGLREPPSGTFGVRN